MKLFSLLWFVLLFFGLKSPMWGDSLFHWNGYVQGRYQSDLDQLNGFSLRRAKLWVKGRVPGTQHWQYKLQTVFSAKNQGALILQDAYGEFQWKTFSIRLGQMVPAFSLQRYQPDYQIPLIERATVVSALIPSAESGARDIGMQVHGTLPHDWLEIYGGIFNGNGGNRAGNEDTHFLFTQRSIWHVVQGKDYQFQMGASLAYRETNGMVFKKILGSSVTFQGRDVRFGIEGMLHIKHFLLQGEWIQARLSHNQAEGYYLLTSLLASPQHQLSLSMERYQDAIAQTVNDPWFILGYNYRWHQDKAKLMLDTRFQKGVEEWHSQFTIQIQWFFN